MIDKIEVPNNLKPIEEKDENTLREKSNSEYQRIESKIEIIQK